MLLIIAATQLESSLLRKQIKLSETSDPELFSGMISEGRQLNLLHTGVGPTSTAITLTRFLERATPRVILMIGCGGSYPNSGLKIGDLALASEEIFGDLGVMTDQKFLPLDEMDIPTTPPPVQRVQLNSPLQKPTAELLRISIKKTQNRLVCGPFVTVSTCSGYSQLSLDLESRTGGICENMEGAAAAQVCSLYQVPFLELRGISNPTGTRDPEQWDLKRGAESAQWGAVQILKNWTLLEKNLCSS